MSSVPPPSYEHPGSPPSRPELPEGVLRQGPVASVGPPGLTTPDAPGVPAPPARLDELPRWPAWAPVAALALTFAIALAGLAILAVAAGLAGYDVDASDPPPGVTIGGTVIQDLALILAAVVFARITTASRPTAAQFGLRGVAWRPALGWTLAIWLAFILFSALWAAALNITENDDLPAELGADDSTLALVAVTLLVTIVAPITEEFFFRGFCFTALRRWLGLWGGAALTGAIFGAIHLGGSEPEFIVPLAIFGLGLCLLYAKTGSLLPCLVLHSLNNSLALGVSQEWTWEIPLLMLAAAAVVAGLGLAAARAPSLNRPGAEVSPS